MPRALTMPRACGAFLCLMAIAVAVAASNHPRNSRKSREALLDDDAILEKAALRTGESPREILRLLGRVAARRNGSPEAGLPRLLDDPDDISLMEGHLGSTGGRLEGGMRPRGHSKVESPHDKDGGRRHNAGRRHDLDTLLRLSGFPAISNSGRRDHQDSKRGGSGLGEEEAILDFLEEVVAQRGSREGGDRGGAGEHFPREGGDHHGSTEAGGGAGDLMSADDGPTNGKATAQATSRRSTRTLVRSPSLHFLLLLLLPLPLSFPHLPLGLSPPQ